MKPKRTISTPALGTIIALLICSSVASNAFASQKTSKPQKQIVNKRTNAVIELHNIEQVKEAFQRDSGKVRLVTILSPT